MEYRRLGASGFSVPALSFGTGTFGGKGELFGSWGNTDVAEARRLIDICLDAGVSMFDTADVYSTGESERIARRPSTRFLHCKRIVACSYS
ncbi:MAG: aldo/keto reductase [Hyphomicrobium sp.]|nr:aldo/keto reductase [Hyphomicrobium sp.]